MAVKPPNPVPIPEYEGTITMLHTDHLQLTFTEAGLFCTNDHDDFIPRLPNGEHFERGESWPDKDKYPDGAKPAPKSDFDAVYEYHTQAGAKCGDLINTTQKTISVGSGQS